MNDGYQAGYNTTVTNLTPDHTGDPAGDGDFISPQRTATKGQNLP